MPALIRDSDASLSGHNEMLDRTAIMTPPHNSNTMTTIPRRVSFAAAATLYLVRSYVDYTPEELEASWFDVDERDKIMSNAIEEVMLMDYGCLVRDTPDVSRRGLQRFTREGRKTTRQNRLDAYDAVCSEIERQHKLRQQWLNDEPIANAYFTYSEPCAMTAELIGKRDEIEAWNIYNEENPIYSR